MQKNVLECWFLLKQIIENVKFDSPAARVAQTRTRLERVPARRHGMLFGKAQPPAQSSSAARPLGLEVPAALTRTNVFCGAEAPTPLAWSN
jgi:hypothetical protein